MQYFSAEADNEYARSKCLRHMNLQTAIVIAICPSRLVALACSRTESECVQLEVQAIYWLSRQKQQKELSVPTLNHAILLLAANNLFL